MGCVRTKKEEGSMAALKGLRPEKVFEYFEKLCSVPHGSGNTKIISDLCVGFAKELGLRYRQEACNNLIIWKDGSAGYEQSEPIILQGHIDMVCAKTDECAKDMAAEGLDLRTDGEWVWADQTSLGGDNGIAVAMILAILADDTLPHPPLEAVFTVDEEVGMDGAFALDCSDLKGKKLLNLDSEEEGIFTVSCAGGMRADCTLPGKREPLGGESCYAVTLSGLQGGHSGGDIDKGRGSANALMGRVLYSAMEQLPGLRLAAIQGGRFDNVICSRCDAVIAVPAGKEADLEQFIRGFDATLKNEYAGCDAGVTLECAKTEAASAVSAETTSVMLHTLLALPQGVEEMSADFPGPRRDAFGGGRTAFLLLHPLLHCLAEGDACSARARHRGVCGRHGLRARQLSRLAVRTRFQAPRAGAWRLPRPHRRGGQARGDARRTGVRALH